MSAVLTVEEIARAFDVSVEDMLENWQLDALPRLQMALFRVAVKKQRDLLAE